jgi:hypothetical protein
MLLFQTGGTIAGLQPKKKEPARDDSARTASPDISPQGKRADSPRISLDTIPARIHPAKKIPEKKLRRPGAYELGLQKIDPTKREEAGKSYEQGLALLKTKINDGRKHMDGLKKSFPQLNDACNKAVSDAYAEEGFKYVISGFQNHSRSIRGSKEYNRGQDMVERAEAAFHKAVTYYGGNADGIKARLRKLIVEDNARWAPIIARGMQGTESRTYPVRVQGLIDKISGFK